MSENEHSGMFVFFVFTILKDPEVKKQIMCLRPTPLFNHIPESFHVLGVPFQ